MTTRTQTTSSALERLRVEVGEVAGRFDAARGALPPLAMGTDAEGLVHVGIDRTGEVVRLELESGWRDTLPAGGLGAALSEALQQAVHVRTGDWAGAVAVAGPATSSPGAPDDGASPHVENVAVEQGWVETMDDDALRSVLLASLNARPGVSEPVAARPDSLRDLESRAQAELHRQVRALPPFMAQPVQRALEVLHEDTSQALGLPIACEAAATPALRSFGAGLHESMTIAGRPGRLPEASYALAVATVALTGGLAQARGPRRGVLGRWRRRAS